MDARSFQWNVRLAKARIYTEMPVFCLRFLSKTGFAVRCPWVRARLACRLENPNRFLKKSQTLPKNKPNKPDKPDVVVNPL